MIIKWKHKGLKLFYDTGSKAKIPNSHADKIHDILQALAFANHPLQMNFPGLDLHALTGKLKGYYSVKVSANWRIVFTVEGKNATDVDLIDYH
jgi:toxin HigB-1